MKPESSDDPARGWPLRDRRLVPGGVTGFGYSLVATPLLLLLGFPLPFVVTVNLALACITRMPVAYRFRADLNRRRATGMIAGSVPGLWLGAAVLTTIDESAIKVGAGIVVMIAAVLLWRALSAPPPRPVPGAPLIAGFGGGFLATAASLNGAVPVLLLARDRAAPRSRSLISPSTSSPRPRSA